MAFHKKTVLKYISLAVGCICTVAGGSIAAINAYSNDLRDTFNLTQSQVSVIMAVGNLGYSTVVVPGLFWEKFGAVWTSVLGLILGTVSNFGVAFGVRFAEWFAENYWAILLCTLLLGFGSCFLFTNALVTNTLNFTILRRGRVVGLLSAFFWAGNSIFSAIYVSVYNTDPTKRGNLEGYFLMGATCFAIVSVLSLIFTRHYPITHDVERYIKEYENEKIHLLDERAKETQEIKQSDNGTDMERNNDSELENKETENILELSTGAQRTLLSRYVPNLSYGDLPFTDLWINLDFHLIFWPCVLCQAIQFTVIFNMSTYFEAFDMMDQIGKPLALRSIVLHSNLGYMRELMSYIRYTSVTCLSISAIATVGGPLVGSLSKFAGGLLSDLTFLKLPRVWLITVTNLCQAAVVSVCIFAADIPAVTISLAVIHYIAVGTQMSVVPTLVGDLYGVKHFGRNWGIISFVNAIVASVFQILMGILYDQEKQPGETVCHGNHCFQTTFTVFTVAAFISVVLDFILFRRHWKKYKQFWRDEVQNATYRSVLRGKAEDK